MSRKASATAVGAFVLIAIIAGSIGIIFLGSIKLTARPAEYVLFFNESLNGLNPGAAVKFRGIKVGRVKRILICLKNQNPEDFRLPVIIELDFNAIDQLCSINAQKDENYDAAFNSLIDNGLRAQLVLESIITGLYYIEFDYHKFATQAKIKNSGPLGYPEIPTTPSRLAGLKNTTGETLARFAAIDINKLTSNLVSIVDQFNRSLEGLDTRNLTKSITDAADAFTSRINELEIRKLTEAFEETTGAITERMEDEEISKAIENLNNTLASLNTLITSASTHFIGSDAPVRYEIQKTLTEFREAAEAIRALADELERNPQTLITGKGKNNDNQ